MTTLTITAEGQITLNKALLRHLGLGPSDRLAVVEQPNGKLIVEPAAPARTGRMADAFSMLHREGMKALSVQEIDEPMGRSRAEDDARVRAARFDDNQ